MCADKDSFSVFMQLNVFTLSRIIIVIIKNRMNMWQAFCSREFLYKIVFNLIIIRIYVYRHTTAAAVAIQLIIIKF